MFNGEEFLAPANWDAVLRPEYGDYMKPVKAPTMHGGFEIIDTERSYRELLPEIREKHKRDNWNQRIQHLKRILKLK